MSVRDCAACGGDRQIWQTNGRARLVLKRMLSQPAPAPLLGGLPRRVASVALGFLIRLQGGLSVGFIGRNEDRQLGGLALGGCALLSVDSSLPGELLFARFPGGFPLGRADRARGFDRCSLGLPFLELRIVRPGLGY